LTQSLPVYNRQAEALTAQGGKKCAERRSRGGWEEKIPDPSAGLSVLLFRGREEGGGLGRETVLIP